MALYLRQAIPYVLASLTAFLVRLGLRRAGHRFEKPGTRPEGTWRRDVMNAPRSALCDTLALSSPPAAVETGGQQLTGKCFGGQQLRCVLALVMERAGKRTPTVPCPLG